MQDLVSAILLEERKDLSQKVRPKVSKKLRIENQLKKIKIMAKKRVQSAKELQLLNGLIQSERRPKNDRSRLVRNLKPKLKDGLKQEATRKEFHEARNGQNRFRKRSPPHHKSKFLTSLRPKHLRLKTNISPFFRVIKKRAVRWTRQISHLQQFNQLVNSANIN